MEARLTQSLLQAGASTFDLPLNLAGEAGLQLGPLGTHLLVLGLDVVLAVLALVLQREKDVLGYLGLSGQRPFE